MKADDEPKCDGSSGSEAPKEHREILPTLDHCPPDTAGSKPLRM